MINANHVKRGMVFNLENELFLLQSFEHHKPGKGAAVVRMKLKSLRKKTTIEKTFRSGTMVEEVQLDKISAVYSYREKDNVIFMDTESYEQIIIAEVDVGDISKFLKEDVELQIFIHEGQPVSIVPPNFVELEVKYAEEGLRGNTTTNPTKEVTLETGATVQVPLFIKRGNVVKIDLRNFTYVERVQS